MSVAEQKPVRTRDSIVVQRLYDRDPGFSAGGIRRRGNEGESVVEVRYIVADLTQELEESLPGLTGPNGTGSNGRPAYPLDAPVGLCIFSHRMSLLAEKLRFGSKDRILAAGLLVIVMNE